MATKVTMDIKELSIQSNLSVKTIRTKLVREPYSLPPRILIRGQKKLIWLSSDVEEFYQRQVRGYGSNPAFSNTHATKQPEQAPETSPKKRGRPRKVDYISKENGNSKT